MKKRILSTMLAAVMVVSSCMTVFAAINITDSAETVYEGNDPFIMAEKILDELNADASAATSFENDKTNHAEQLTTIKAVNDYLATKTYTDAELIGKLEDCINLICANPRMTSYKKQYLVALVEAETNDTIKNGLKAHDTTGKTLRESFGLLDDYVAEMQTFFAAQGIDENDYNAETSKKYVAEPLLAFLKIMFAQDGTAASYTEDGKYMRENYIKEFINNDRAKKTMAVLFGADLTKEIVSDSVTNTDLGIVRHIKEYITSDTATTIPTIKGYMNNMMVEDKSVAVNGAFDALGKVADAAYENDPMHDDVVMVMGDGQNAGLIELLVKSVDNNTLDASNIWLNLFLSEHIQTKSVTRPLNTLSAATPAPERIEIRDNSSINFVTAGLEETYGISADVTLNNNWFKLVCYVEDTPGTFIESNYVTHNGSDIQITQDNTKGEYYDAYFVLYRKAASADATTFIESYPVNIYNKAISTGTGGGGTTKYVLTYETNGGTQYTAERYSKGATVTLDKIPAKEGYKFAGWYLDKELTQKVTSVVMNSGITVYAAWTLDEGVEVPEMLNGEDHFAYVVGYPDGNVRPQANITRAEAVTVLFRLLKEEVREANLTENNSFTDVNEEDWFNTAVSTLAALKIVNGRTETEFMPNEYITRAEFAAIFARFAEYEYTLEGKFKDVNGHWAADYIREAAAYGWIKGYEDNTFRPDQRITRAEAITLINRVLKRIPEYKEDLAEGMVKWADNNNSNAWYYIAIQEATNSHKFERKANNFEKWTELTSIHDWTKYEK